MKTRWIFSAVAFLSLCSLLYSQTLIATIPVGHEPNLIAANPRTNRVYVTDRFDGTVTVIDGSSNQVITTISLGAHFETFGVDVNPVSNRIYVSAGAHDGEWMVVIDGNTNTIVRGVRIGGGLYRVGVNPATNRIYLSDSNNQRIYVVDGQTNTRIATVELNGNAVGMAVNARTNLVFAPFLCCSGGVEVTDGSNREITIFDVPTGGLLTGAAVDPLRNRLYVTDSILGNLYIADTKTFTFLHTVSGLNQPLEVATMPGSDLVVVADWSTNSAIFVDAISLAVTQTIPVGTAPNGIAANTSTRRVYVASRNGTVSVIAY